MSLLIAGAGVAGRRVDVRVDAGRVAEIAPGLARRPGERVLRADGGRLLPGLHDHHLHLRAASAARSSVAVGPPAVVDRAGLAARLREAAATAHRGEWVRAVGYHESVAGELDRRVLDDVVPDRPVRVQHRTGALWIVNSLGLRHLGLDDTAPAGTERHDAAPAGIERDHLGRPTGRLVRLDAWLRTRLPAQPPDLEGLSADAAARGVTGFTDATPGLSRSDVDQLADQVASGRVRQRVCVMCPVEVDVPDHPLVGRGPVKVLLDDDTIPTPEELAGPVGDAHRAGRAVAVHCVTRLQLVVTLAALERAGTRPGDRIEHGSVVPPELVDPLLRLGLTVVTNPSFVSERGDRYAVEVDPDDRPHLYRCASLQRAGIPVAAGTDAPFGSPDPWAAVRAAVDRRTASGAVLGGGERVGWERAVGLFLGPAADPGSRRRVEVGGTADLCLLRPGAADRLGPDPVAATLVAGRLVFGPGD